MKKAKTVTRYRVNDSELFNLQSMRDHLANVLDDLLDDKDSTLDEIEKAQARLEEVDGLLESAYYVGAPVTWPELKRIREIRDERNIMRYSKALANGASEQEAAYAFM